MYLDPLFNFCDKEECESLGSCVYSPYSGCQAINPESFYVNEVCNGIDDNGNGLIDEGCEYYGGFQNNNYSEDIGLKLRNEYFCKYDEEGAIRYQRFSIRDNDGKMIHYEIAISDKGNVSETGGSHFVKCFYPHFLTE